MSVEGEIFNIGVTGSRKSIVRMMNAVIRNAGCGKEIAEGDDIEAINLKLGEFIGKDGKDIGTVDLLDETAMQDKKVQEKKQAFEVRVKACKNCPFECPNAKRDDDFVAPKELESLDEKEYHAKEREYCPWDDPFDAENNDPDNLEPARYLEVIGVEDGPKDNYTARLSYYVYECYGPDDYLHWDDIARLYNCCVWVDCDYYRNGRLMRFEAATIYEPIDGNVKTTRLESGNTEEEYDTFIETLAERYPDFYRPVRDEYFKKKAEEKDRVRLQKERGIKIHYTVWHNFASWEEDGTKAIRCTYAAHLEEAEKKNAWLTKEDLETVMNLRMEKWKGVKDELANCYMNLLMDLYDEDQWTYKDFIDENGHAAIPDSLTEISEFAFDGCTELLSVDIPGSVKVIYTFAFNGCTSLKSVVIQDGVEEIKAGAFKGCSSLTDVTFPKSLKQVHSDSFEGCPCEEAVMTECEARSIL